MKNLKRITGASILGLALCSFAVPTLADDSIVYDGNNIHIESGSLSEITKEKKLDLYVENNSTLNLSVAPYAYAINGIMAGGNQYGFGATDVAAGKKANGSIDFSDFWSEDDFFEKYQIDSVDSFDVLFWAYDNDQSMKTFESGQIHADVSNETIQDSPIFADAKNVYDQNGIKVDFLSKDGNDYNLCITNTTGEYFTFDVENTSFNDYTSSDEDYELYDKYLLNNCKLLITIKPTDEFLETNGIDSVEKIDFTMNVRPLADYFSDYNTDVISIEQ